MIKQIISSRFSISLGICFILVVAVFFVGDITKKDRAGKPTIPTAFSQEWITQVTESPVPSITSTIFAPTIENQSSPVPSASMKSACANIWGIEPPAEIPDWLGTPQNAEGLNTEIKYFILAGKLISTGIVSASECPEGGLSLDGSATTCGMEKAYPQVVEWQNQFDQDIFNAAQENQIPAQIIKRLFAQETQFWPPTSFSPPAYGLGNVTSPGVEPLFTWYDDLYQKTCSEVFSHSCDEPYHALSLEQQQLLRGFFISQNLHAHCPTCLHGIDLEKTGKSIDYFAKLIVANCHQVDLILTNHGYSVATLSYEDAWKLTLANYTIGTGCIMNAIDDMDPTRWFSWEYFTSQLTPGCSVDTYLNHITGK
jgi:hypothetical protein